MPYKESELIPEVNGRVSWMSPNLLPGGYFTKDEVLLRIDDRDYQSTVARSQATLTRAQAEEELARFELGRMEELVKKKLTSQSSLETVLRNHRIADAVLQDSKIALEQAERDLQRTEIRAPYEGLVRSEKVDLGQYVSRGQSIASIYAAQSAEVRLPVADKQLAYLDLPLGHRGELADEIAPEVLLFTDYGGKHYEWTGKLVRTEAEIDSKSRMVTAVVRVNNSDNADQPDLPIGLFVNARIKGRWAEGVITIPRAALRNQNQVLVVDKDNRIYYRSVEVMRFENDNVIVSAGLESGDVVNISPLQTIVEGMRVKPILQSGNS
jgi:RND family efflux transporter MFP subunit